MRLHHAQANPEAFQTMLKMESYVKESGIDKRLLELIKIRASQINRCAFCIDMHTRDARKLGETEERIYLLNAWDEAPHFSEEEKAVLALTEAVTLISQAGVPEEVYEKVRAYFDERQFVALIMAINTINCWNRLSVSTGKAPEIVR
ncbi:carboxymuconolactone decarboxylase family protein [Brevibacillus humidisoli]|uniref:carboxymuconolactone decarboxylase family protein n=1 Tax=Brevibacillus humidisoli TaxID=2895522 RepID=UPI001E4E82F1|nr:carboxymuconolactone decarboxylase family protein [Brevibacillus humidisoli]UFJ39430.1 carboxymuconolactone decarboxylase family protein [Brevibacillus humidisoli]